MARVVAPEAPAAPVTESQDEQEPITVTEQEIPINTDGMRSEAHGNGTEPLKVIRSEFTITVGRLVNRNFNNVRYEESVTFSLTGGTKEEKSEAYAKERDRIIKRVCATAAVIAENEQL